MDRWLLMTPWSGCARTIPTATSASWSDRIGFNRALTSVHGSPSFVISFTLGPIGTSSNWCLMIFSVGFPNSRRKIANVCRTDFRTVDQLTIRINTAANEPHEIAFLRLGFVRRETLTEKNVWCCLRSKEGVTGDKLLNEFAGLQITS